MERPKASEMLTTDRDTVRDRRAPQRRREKVSRPSSSVPHQCVAEGPCRRWSRSMAAGLSRASQGANKPQRTNIASKNAPRAARGWPRIQWRVRSEMEDAIAMALSTAYRATEAGGFALSGVSLGERFGKLHDWACGRLRCCATVALRG